MNTRGFTLIELMIVVVIIGILAVMAIPNMASMRMRAREATVRENCHTVRLAAEDFAVMNLGQYPSDTSDALVSGETMMDLLPNGNPLTNPFTRAATEPVDGPASAAGESGYEPILDAGGLPAGYVVTGYGHATEVARMIAGL